MYTTYSKVRLHDIITGLNFFQSVMSKAKAFHVALDKETRQKIVIPR